MTAPSSAISRALRNYLELLGDFYPTRGSAKLNLYLSRLLDYVTNK
jgi:hypothetical protein